MALKIEDYALIGNCETAALVGRDGSIDWLCWPRFDSNACFAALLGETRHGRWQIAPRTPVLHTRRQYRKGTLILETLFETEEGEVIVSDCMPLHDSSGASVVRQVHAVRGIVPMRMELIIRFDYGSAVPWVSSMEDGSLRAIAGPDMLILRTPVTTRGEDLKTVAEFSVPAGQTVPFVLSYGPSNLAPPAPVNPVDAFAKTEAFWCDWIKRCNYRGPWSEAVERSLITLKALTYAPTGGILAAATTSLPENLGGTRNWDYRFCWLRDATFTLFALMSSGYYAEASEWQQWLVRAVAGSPDQVQIMYGLAGERQLEEWDVKWLPGYEKSSPARVGNAASNQLQLDLYGEICSVFHHARKGGLSSNGIEAALQRALLEHLEKIWREPDNGIWEFRGPRRHFTHSKMMAWLAFDRAIQSHEQFGLEGPVERWIALRQEIHDDVCRNGFDAELGSFVQAYGTQDLDASLLLMPLIGFLPASDPRVQGTVHAIERKLMPEGLVLRYDTHNVDDGLPGGEGAFLACSFWLVDNYVLQGRNHEAQQLFERLLSLRNDVGLLSEEYNLRQRRQLGNYPQAFSHVALVNSAIYLSRAMRNLEQKAA